MKWLKVLLTGILVSMFYFPFEFTFLPGINTKMILAAVGLVFLLYSLVQKRELSLPRSLLILLLLPQLLVWLDRRVVSGRFSAEINLMTEDVVKKCPNTTISKIRESPLPR